MNLEPGVLVLIVGGTVVIGALTLAAAVGTWQRLLVLGMFSGLLFFSGVGAAHAEVPRYYIGYYFGFLAAFGVGFWLSRVFLAGLSRIAGRRLPTAAALLGQSRPRVADLVICAYILLHLVPLFYPELRLSNLISPSSPNLTAAFAGRWVAQPKDALLELVKYARLLLTPFFYTALYYHRTSVWRLILVMGALLYLQYADQGYLGRAVVAISFATVWLGLWVETPRYRARLVVVACLGAILMVVGSYYYTSIRIGGNVTSTSPLSAAIHTLESETSFPRKVGTRVIESGARVDLGSYIRWIATLPLPKLITGEIPGARINYEISELVLGVGPGDRGWYVVLPGLVAESVYVYGKYFFWVHAVFTAVIGGFLTRLMERTPQLLFLKGYVVAIFALDLNRAGISGPMAIFVNEFLLFYVVVVVAIVGLNRKAKPARVFSSEVATSERPS